INQCIFEAIAGNWQDKLDIVHILIERFRSDPNWLGSVPQDLDPGLDPLNQIFFDSNLLWPKESIWPIPNYYLYLCTVTDNSVIHHENFSKLPCESSEDMDIPILVDWNAVGEAANSSQQEDENEQQRQKLKELKE
uniref:Uncharacterized protein n=1 Tax=Romanomermis culicivorax TaxID=13658 RepID=A0A915I8P3_ROMCU